MSEHWDVWMINGALRAGQAVMISAPTVVVGVLVAAVLRVYLGPAVVRRWVEERQAGAFWLLGLAGLVAPVCSFGVWPVLDELRRGGVPGRWLLAIALVARLCHPLALAYGASVFGGFWLMALALGVTASVTAAFFAWGEDDPADREDAGPADALVTSAGGRLAATLAAAGEIAAGPMLRPLAVALAGVFVVSMLTNPDTFSHTLAEPDPRAPAIAGLVGLPAYVGQYEAMMLVGELFKMRQSFAAALVLLVCGAALNLGTFYWLAQAGGWARMLRAGAAAIGVALAAGLALNVPFYGAETLLLHPEPPPGTVEEEHSHSHAFDVLARPFATGSFPPTWTRVGEKFWDRLSFTQTAAAMLWGGLLLGGLALKLFARRDAGASQEEAGTDHVPAVEPPRPEPVPAAAWGAVALAVTALAVGTVYAFVADPPTLLDEMHQLRADCWFALRDGHADETAHYLARWETTSGRLPLSAYLRRGQMTDAERAASERMARALADLRAAVERRDRGEIDSSARECWKSVTLCRAAYSGDPLKEEPSGPILPRQPDAPAGDEQARAGSR